MDRWMDGGMERQNNVGLGQSETKNGNYMQTSLVRSILDFLCI